MLRSGIRLSPSDIRYASLGGEYNITATIGSNITLTRSAYHFQFAMAMQCLSRKKDRECFTFSVLFLSVRVYCAIADTPLHLFFTPHPSKIRDFCHLLLKGSDGSAAGGGRSDLSEWQRSARDEGALAPRTFAGHRNRRRLLGAVGHYPLSIIHYPLFRHSPRHLRRHPPHKCGGQGVRRVIIYYPLSIIHYSDTPPVTFGDTPLINAGGKGCGGQLSIIHYSGAPPVTFGDTPLINAGGQGVRRVIIHYQLSIIHYSDNPSGSSSHLPLHKGGFVGEAWFGIYFCENRENRG